MGKGAYLPPYFRAVQVERRRRIRQAARVFLPVKARHGISVKVGYGLLFGFFFAGEKSFYISEKPQIISLCLAALALYKH